MPHYAYIDAPRPELYDLQHDPGERHNLASVECIPGGFHSRKVGKRSRRSTQGQPLTAPAPRGSRNSGTIALSRLCEFAVSRQPPRMIRSAPTPRIRLGRCTKFCAPPICAGWENTRRRRICWRHWKRRTRSLRRPIRARREFSGIGQAPAGIAGVRQSLVTESHLRPGALGDGPGAFHAGSGPASRGISGIGPAHEPAKFPGAAGAGQSLLAAKSSGEG